MIEDLKCSNDMVNLIDQMKDAETVELNRFSRDIQLFCEDDSMHKVAGSKRIMFRSHNKICRCDYTDPYVETITLGKASTPEECTTLKRINKTNILIISDPNNKYYKRITFHYKKSMFGTKKNVLVIDSIDYDDEPLK